MTQSFLTRLTAPPKKRLTGAPLLASFRLLPYSSVSRCRLSFFSFSLIIRRNGKVQKVRNSPDVEAVAAVLGFAEQKGRFTLRRSHGGDGGGDGDEGEEDGDE
jgi:hypothetical protein